MNRYTFMELDGALAERLNEILLELPKKAPYKERRAFSLVVSKLPKPTRRWRNSGPCWRATKLCRSSWTMC